jgi:hypothetical protein
MNTVTPRIIRDTLALKGPMGLRELCKALTLPNHVNPIQAMLLDLAAAGEVSYNYETGAWEANVVL